MVDPKVVHLPVDMVVKLLLVVQVMVLILVPVVQLLVVMVANNHKVVMAEVMMPQSFQ